MVGSLVKLQLKLTWRSVSRNVGLLIGMILGLLWGLGMAAAGVAGLVFLRTQDVHWIGPITTVAFGMLTLSWPLLTLLVAGSDPTLDPGRFALLPLRARQLMPGLFVAGLAGLGTLLTVILSVGQIVSWSGSPATLALAVVALLGGVPTCVLLSRSLVSLFSGALNKRKYRDIATMVLALLAISIGVVMQLVQRFLTDNPGQVSKNLGPIGQVAGWTPIAWFWSLPWEAADGRWWAVAVKFLLAAGLLVGMWRLWENQLDKALVSPVTSSGDGTKVKGHSFVDRLFPSTPAGAVAARSLRYWRRDPRHLIALVSVVAMPFLMSAPVLINRDLSANASWAIGLYPMGGMLLMAAVCVAAEICYDGSAISTHIVSGLSGRDDRWGRVLALLVLLIPIGLITATVFLALSGEWRLAPAMLGGTLGALGAGVGVGSVAGALWQYPTPPPGENAFAKSSGGGLVSLLSTMVCMIGSIIVSLPLIALVLLAPHDNLMLWLTPVAACVLAALYTWIGVAWGGRILDRTWPEVLTRVRFEKS